MQNIALISGLIGALASAAFSFVVRLILDKRSQRYAERRLAYVYLVSVSEVIAADIIFRSYIKVIVPDRAAKDLISSAGSYEPSHKVCVMLADMFSKLTTEEIHSDPSYRAIPRVIKNLLDGVKESRLSTEQLSKLPREVIFAFHQFQGAQSIICQSIDVWREFVENGERFWITPEIIHEQWRALERFTSEAHLLHKALVDYGAATAEEAGRLLSKQVALMNEKIDSKWKDSPMLAAAAFVSKEAVLSETATEVNDQLDL